MEFCSIRHPDYEVLYPGADPIPVVVEVPHAGLWLDPQSLGTLAAPAYSIAQDADLYVDELYASAPRFGASLLIAHSSRYVCDLNRGVNDYDGLSVQGGGERPMPHGLIWRTTTEDRHALTRTLNRDELERRLTLFYKPYHAALEELLSKTRERFGWAILLSAHSMPSQGRLGHDDPGRRRADVVTGTRGGTTAAARVRDAVEGEALLQGWSVAHDDPYRGGFTTAHYGNPSGNVHAIQVELARRLYMDEASLEKKPDHFDNTQRFCGGLVERLAALRLSGA
jgi:N-formylglutamate amidohydrolase